MLNVKRVSEKSSLAPCGNLSAYDDLGEGEILLGCKRGGPSSKLTEEREAEKCWVRGASKKRKPGKEGIVAECGSWHSFPTPVSFAEKR